MWPIVKVLLDMGILLNRLADPITCPVVRWLNRLTGASSARLIPWFFGVSAVFSLTADIMQGHRLGAGLTLFSAVLWTIICRRLAEQIDQMMDAGVLPELHTVLVVYLMRAFMAAFVPAHVIGLIDFEWVNVCRLAGSYFFLLGLTAAVNVHPGRKSAIRRAVEKTLETLASLRPQPQPVPAFVGARYGHRGPHHHDLPGHDHG